MTLRAWPPFPQTIGIADALDPLLAWIKATGWRYTPRPNPPYEGLDTGASVRVTCPSPDEYLPNKHCEPTTTLERALVVAFQYGIEQGIRIEAQRWARSGVRDPLLDEGETRKDSIG